MEFKTLGALIGKFALETPHKIAIERGSQKITYKELEENTTRTANFLQEMGASNGNISVIFENSIELVEAILGVIKSGGIFAPVDPNFPNNRIDLMLKEINADWIITQEKWLNKLDEMLENQNRILNVLVLDNCSVNEADFTNLRIYTLEDILKRDARAEVNSTNKNCYIYFTSGSTGKPKGILGRHTSLLHFIQWEIKEFGVKDCFRGSQLTSPSFDPFLRDTFVPLCAGGTLCIPETREIVLNPKALVRWLEEEKITLVHMVPTLFKAMMREIEDHNYFKELKYILLAGEMLRGNDIKKFITLFKGQVELVNLYGPTETTLAKFFYRIKESDIDRATIPVGKAIHGAQGLVLDNELQSCDVGSIGEIYIRTPFISSGYYNNRDLTRGVFIVNPLGNNPKDIIYKTGDTGRFLPTGDLEIIGRVDHQVKIRGYRIELGEIENRLLQYKGVKEAVVIAKETEAFGEGKLLWGYITGEDLPKGEELKEYLMKELPEYMIPAYIIHLEKMPLTPNGKVDRRALPKLEENMIQTTEYIPPSDDVEKALLNIWQQILNIDRIGVNHNFFNLGGHSLKATAMVQEIHKAFNVEIPLGMIFKFPTIKALGEIIRGLEKDDYIEISPVGEQAYYQASAAQKRLYILQQLNKNSIAYNMPGMMMIEGELDVERLRKAFEGLITRHEVFRTSFEVQGESIIQRINPEVSFNMEYKEVHVKEYEEEALIDLVPEFIRPHDLSTGPLIRVGLMKIVVDGEDLPNMQRHMLIYDLHHIISDGISMGILTREFIQMYQGIELPPMKLQYKDFAHWQNELFESDKIQLQKNYWMNHLQGELPLLRMPLDYKRGQNQTFEGDAISFEISEDLVGKMKTISAEKNTTINILLLSLYNLLLHKYTQQEDVIVGITVSGRRHRDLDHVVGAFINFLPIRSQITQEQSFLEFLDSQDNIITDSYNNQDYPFDRLIEDVEIKRDASRNPIFDTMLIFHNEFEEHSNANIDGLVFRKYQYDKKTAKLDFKMDAIPSSTGEIRCLLEYNTSLFKEETMLVLSQHFLKLIELIVNDTTVKLSDINLFSKEEEETFEIKRGNNIIINPLKLSIAASFTADPVLDYVDWWSKKMGLDLECRLAPYNQVFQTLLNINNSVFHDGDINMIMLRFEDWIRDTEEARQPALLEESFEELKRMMKSLKNDSNYLVGIFPVGKGLGLRNAIVRKIEEMNNEWRDFLKEIENVTIVDFTEVGNLYGIKEIFDPIKDENGHMPFTDDYYAAIGTTIARKIAAMKLPPFKVIAVDCDNTLWKGVCGEDGTFGIKIDQYYGELQRLLVQKQEEGMLIVLLSKNNEDDVWEVFNENPQMILKKEHIAGHRINWQPKSQNLQQLAEELNLGLDSFLFIDDSGVETAEMITNRPEVLTLKLPENPQQIPMFLKHIWALDRLKLTEEDKKRTKLYLVEQQRKQYQDTATSLQDFLKELKLQMVMGEIKEEQVPRVSQLTQRTNQFNLSTKRRSESEIKELMKNNDIKCWAIEVSDKFGEYGLTGVIIGEIKHEILYIDTFLLSCRVLGRGIEDAIMAELARFCKENGIREIKAEYIPTAKNRPVKGFVERVMEVEIQKDEGRILFRSLVEDLQTNVDYITCTNEKASIVPEKNKQEDEVIFRLDHIAIAVKDIKGMRDYYNQIGYKCGPIVHDPLQKVELVMCDQENHTSLELVGATCEESPVNNILKSNEKHSQPYHLCYQVKELSTALNMLDQKGIEWEVIREAKPAELFNQNKVMFLYVKGIGLLELVEVGDAIYEKIGSNKKVDYINAIISDGENVLNLFNLMGYMVIDKTKNNNMLWYQLSSQYGDEIYLVYPIDKQSKGGLILSSFGPGVYNICYHLDDLESVKEVLNRTPYGVMELEKTDDLMILNRVEKVLYQQELSFALYHENVVNTQTQTAANWQMDLQRAEKTRHYHYLLPLVYATGEKLLQLPINENSEIDIVRKPFEAPRNNMEEKLAEIWKQVLKIDDISIHDNFFDLGGHSLKAMSILSGIYKTFKVEVNIHQLFSAPTIKDLAEYIQGQEEKEYKGINPVEERDYYSVSSAQKRVYILQEMDKDSLGYNMPVAVTLEGQIDVKKIEEIFDRLIGRHEALRTSFILVDGNPMQYIHKEVDFKLQLMEAGENELESVVRDFVKAFDLSKGPLFRVGLVKQSPEKYLMIVDMHHIISDGVSIGILIKEFTEIYRGMNLDPLRIQYKDYSEWQRELINSGKIDEQKKYWLQQFEGEIPVLNLVGDYPRPAIQSFEGERLNYLLEKELTNSIRKTCKETGTTMYMFLLSVYNVLLSKYSGQEDIIVGSPIAGRPHSDLNNIIGMFVNTLAMRNSPNSGKTFKEFLAEVKENSLSAYENQDYQFEELVENLNLARDMSRNPLFDVMFTMQNMDMTALEIEELTIRHFGFENTISKFDMTLSATENEDSMILGIEYATRIFKKETIEKFYRHLQHILKQVTQSPDMKLSEIKLLTEDEEKQIIEEFNNTLIDYPRNKTIHHLFEEQVERTPNNVALKFQEYSLTYSQLNSRANQLARLLVEKGVKENVIVGIKAEPSLEMLVGIIGILKAGGAYLPIDPKYPVDRINYMLQDSGAQLLLTQSGLMEKIEFDREVILLDNEELYQGDVSNLMLEIKSQSLAYVIYTSGSTGRPKGVMIEHHSGVNFIKAMTDAIDFTESKSILALTTLSFDIFFLETLLPLTKGLRVVIANGEEQVNPALLKDLLEREKINMLQATPSRIKMILDDKHLFNSKYLQEIMVGGEALSKKLLMQLQERIQAKIYNMYGPTETTIWSTIADLTDSKEITIGKPVANTQIYIVNENNQLQPIGVSGELCIGGAGLARGYLNRSELTQDKFIDHPFVQGEKIYRTGDLAKWRSDGSIEFLGRIDHQVKVRGYRIELGEIENQLLNYEAIKEVVVLAREEVATGYALWGYVTGNREVTMEEIRNFLSRSLPEYMIPSYMLQLEEMPFTPNGKIDRKYLLQLDANVNSLNKYQGPRNEIEEKLVGIWQEVLGKEGIGIYDSFFELGGNSINILKIASEIEGKLEICFPVAHLYINNTIEKIATLIENEGIFKDLECIVKLNNSLSSRNIFIIHGMDGDVYYYKDLAKLLEDEYRVYGIQSKGMAKVEELPKTPKEMITQYIQEIKAVQPEGPYLIAGYCAGAILSYDLVGQLEESGDVVEKLILLDEPAFIPKKYLDFLNFKYEYSRKKIFGKSINNLLNGLLDMLGNIRGVIENKDIQKASEDTGVINGVDRGKIKRNVYGLVNKKLQIKRKPFSPTAVIKAKESKGSLYSLEMWQEMVCGEIEIYESSGDHETILNKPHAVELANRIKEILKLEK